MGKFPAEGVVLCFEFLKWFIYCIYERIITFRPAQQGGSIHYRKYIVNDGNELSVNGM